MLGYFIHYDPAPILVIQPTLEIAEAWSKDRLAPMLRDTPALRDRVRDARSRDSGNTIRHKTFIGGHLTAAGANSAASLASRPIRILLCDEVARYPSSAGSEGSPIQLAATRTAAFWNSREVYISSPGSKGSCPLEDLWNESDQRRYFVPCKHCEHYQTLRWPQVKFTDARGELLPVDQWLYHCEACDAGWDDVERWSAVARGEWRATAPFTGTAGFHLNALAAPWESRRIEHLVRQFLRTKSNPELLKVFVQTVLSEWWEEKYETLGAEGLEARREHYPLREGRVVVPRGAVVLTAGVDVQADRLEVQIQGYGIGFESWKIEYHVIDGDPSANAVWKALWVEVLLRPFETEAGGLDYIRATAIDTGANTMKVYDFCRPRWRYNTPDGRLGYVFAVKGDEGAGPIWPLQGATRNNKGRIPLYTIRVDSAKELIYGSLAKVLEPGPGYIHFPHVVNAGQPFDRRYFDQLTSERVVDRRSPNGTVKRVWEKKSDARRNEGLDTAVYGEAAFRGLLSLGLNIDREAQKRGLRIVEGGADQPPPQQPQPPRPGGGGAAPQGRRRSTSNWLNR